MHYLAWGYGSSWDSTYGSATALKDWLLGVTAEVGFQVSRPLLHTIDEDTASASTERAACAPLRGLWINRPTGAGWCIHSSDIVEALRAVNFRMMGPADGVHYVALAQKRVEATRNRGVTRRAVLCTAPDRPFEALKFDCFHCAMEHAVAKSDTAYATYARVAVIVDDHSNLNAWLPTMSETSEEPSLTTATNKDKPGELPDRCCATCGRLGHNSRTCTNPLKAHDKIGIEIEGRWHDWQAVKRRSEDRGMTGCGDGSVNYSPDTDAEPYEFQTSPGSLAHALNQLVDFYPDETDASCGMHVHVSFKATDASLLHTQEFFDYFRKRWIEWGTRMNVRGRDGDRCEGGNHQGEFWKRLFGDNSYCKVNTMSRMAPQRMDRYHQLNFSAWQEHQTVECRLLPMFKTMALGVSAVQELISIFEDFLALPEVVSPYADQVVLPDVPLTEDAAEVLYIDEPPTLEECLTRELEVDEFEPVPEGFVRTFRGTVAAGATIRMVAANLLAA